MSEITEEEKVNMKRDIACNGNKIEELKADFKSRDPAKETEIRLNKYDVEIVKINGKLDGISTKLDTHINDQKEDFRGVRSEIADIKNLITKFIWGVAIVSLMIVLGYVLIHVGLPKPLI